MRRHMHEMRDWMTRQRCMAGRGWKVQVIGCFKEGEGRVRKKIYIL